MADSGLSKEHRAALVICAHELDIDPASLLNKNPFAMTTPRSLILQNKLRQMFPRYCQELAELAEVPLSLGAAALLDGEDIQITEALAVELQTNRPEQWAEMQNTHRELQIAQFESQAAARQEAFAASREQISANDKDLRMESIQVARQELNEVGQGF